ncbi:uncharacterized protein LOC108146790 [Drosophila elegans]|uniref:uncharacterized protein LOC108146790 n=1 Tax=Drosophila elegans TaxID=30023 RepID=UPI0007E815F8|nr:uncharacterized protein LOC108146790 [Drosophila elegans]
MNIVLATILGYLLLGLMLSSASIATATTGVIPAVPAAVPGVVPLATSHQFVTRNWIRPHVTTTPVVATYPNTYYKYSGGYPAYPSYPAYNYPYATTYQYTYPYYYPTYNYGYGYKGVW